LSGFHDASGSSSRNGTFARPSANLILGLLGGAGESVDGELEVKLVE